MTRFLFFCLAASLFIYGCNSDSKNKSAASGDSLEAAKTKSASKKNIVFFGNSLTAGYGLDDPSLAFAGLIQKRIDSLGLAYKVINAGVSGETTAGGNSRIDWLLKQPLDVFILELGGNDGLRGIPVSETKKNLQSILDKVKAKYPDAKLILAGMQIPPNMGQEYTSQFRMLYADIAKTNHVQLIPFLLEGVGGEPKLNLPDGIHPNVAGHKIVAENVWSILKDQL
ncbi:Esterase TesA [Dyadobacter sp. CECT 9275]|uniref:Esterase TesA n=1 Tax=Dyadobacter helix TaxID=2822344 RepID=A0A916JB40_9BACT|nr:arylesterase [Dyadobacter sp. CECT 9275]CAG4999096.1 Esterase TesA [Dyadobacter sp. CECT 9275]